MKSIFLIVPLLFLASADNRIISTCQPCALGKCWVNNGGPFINTFDSPLDTCTSNSSYRYIEEYICASDCSGCMMKIYEQINGVKDLRSSFCSESPQGQTQIKYWQQLLSKNGRNTTYNWCNCTPTINSSSLQNPTNISLKSSGNNFTITCSTCQSTIGTCLTVKGGPLNLTDSNNEPTCSAAFPGSVNFICNSKCSGCQIISINSMGRNQSVCSESSDGRIITNLFDILYIVQGNFGQYDWCNCPVEQKIGNAENDLIGSPAETTKQSNISPQGSSSSSSSNMLTSTASGVQSSQGQTQGNLQANSPSQTSQNGVIVLNKVIEVKITCAECGGNMCETYNGGPFTNDVFPIQRQTCGKQYPIIFTFECGSQCSEGCQLNTSSGGSQAVAHCQGSMMGMFAPKLLNERYSMKLGDKTLSSSYKWCNCP